ncbi:MAG: S8 family serine peptidase [Clostridiales bacterium]|jgi:subtilisin family serine protease|nr:S8 family serine peptidase [Clostridiales bacterium]
MKKIYFYIALILIFALSPVILPAALPLSKALGFNGDFYAFSDALTGILSDYGQSDGDTYDPYDSYSSKRIIVKSDSGVGSFGAVAVAEGYGGLHIFQYASAAAAKKAHEHFLSLSAVEWSEPDTIIDTASDDDGSDYEFYLDHEVSSAAEETPSGEYLSWGAAYLGVEAYSSYLTASVGTANLREVVVAVIDSGIDVTHPLFNGRIAAGGKNFTSEPSSSGYAYQDANGHGTHVSGIIANLTLPNVKLLPLKVINSKGAAAFSSIIAALYYTAELKISGQNIYFANLSLSGGISVNSTMHKTYSNALQNIYNLNIIPIVAAGNNGADATSYAPANVACAVTVSSVYSSGSTFLKADNSNYGSYIDLAAPGVSINSAAIGGTTKLMSGTSMATPHVTAIAALLLSDPDNSFSAKQTEALLKAYAVDIGTEGKDSSFGYGLVNTGMFYYSANEIPPQIPDEGEPSGDGAASGSAPYTDGLIGGAIDVPKTNLGFVAAAILCAAVCTVLLLTTHDKKNAKK